MTATRDRDGAEGGDANAAPVPQDRQAQAEGIAQIEHDINLLKRLALRMIESNRFDSKASRELSMSEDVERLRRDIGEEDCDVSRT